MAATEEVKVAEIVAATTALEIDPASAATSSASSSSASSATTTKKVRKTVVTYETDETHQLDSAYRPLRATWPS